MYQSFIQLLEEAGYKKYMSKMGPVYLLERENDRQMVFLTYHKDQKKEPIHLKEYDQKMLEARDTIFPKAPVKMLCILIVDDGKLMEEQFAGEYSFTVWIQDEISGKLYMNEDAKQDFSYLYDFLVQKGEEARRIIEERKSQEEEKKVDWRTYVTPVNVGLILSNSICFGLYMFFGEGVLQKGVSIWTDILLNHEYYRLITSMFLHFDLEHLVSNMLVLFLVGSFVERYMGSFRYLMAYLTTGLVGNMVSFYMDIGTSDLTWAAGASGAIYGVLGILAVILIKTRGRMTGIQGPGIFLFVLGSIFHSYQTAGIDHWAHIGGLVAGIIVGICYRRKQNDQIKKKEADGK